ncbi:hypothetical protein K2173_021248 [Erythroxylum novogranatense]|uniref:Uncharacterized protein n=1 Tax=Erythroxylum novogranatense TaxID=1862640 RepID=A0AAV8TQ24_9ROSI|nr:hypothetical protein K2173_021248 [Erythroxylum novogranatense]
MGSCVSVVYKGTSDSAVKMGVTFGSQTDKLVIPESSIKTFDDLDIKDETFFDSRPWLDSDCEDEFYSVNGDFTPSRGNTPVYHGFSIGTTKFNKTLEEKAPGFVPEPSPTVKRKRLSELFQESPKEDPDIDDPCPSGNQTSANEKMGVKATVLGFHPKPANTTSYVSGANSNCSNERTKNGEVLIEKDKSLKSVQCCLQSLISCQSFSERKKGLSPAVAVHGKA